MAIKKYNKFVNEDIDKLGEWDEEEINPNPEIVQNQPNDQFVGGEYKGESRTKENILEHWRSRWAGTCLETFPQIFSDAYPDRTDYEEFEKDKYGYQDEDDEFEFDAGDEVYNIMNEFDIHISNEEEMKSDDGDCKISEDDWVDFFNDMWSWD